MGGQAQQPHLAGAHGGPVLAVHQGLRWAAPPPPSAILFTACKEVALVVHVLQRLRQHSKCNPATRFPRTFGCLVRSSHACRASALLLVAALLRRRRCTACCRCCGAQCAPGSPSRRVMLVAAFGGAAAAGRAAARGRRAAVAPSTVLVGAHIRRAAGARTTAGMAASDG